MRRSMESAVLAMFLALFLLPAAARAQSARSAGGAGRAVFPAGASWKGVPLSALRFGTGVTFAGPGAATGALQVTMLSTPVAGVTRLIRLTGDVTAGTSTAAGPATFSGLGTLDPGDGTAALLSVPFTLTVTVAPGGASSLALTLDGQVLPAAPVIAGNVLIH